MLASFSLIFYFYFSNLLLKFKSSMIFCSFSSTISTLGGWSTFCPFVEFGDDASQDVHEFHPVGFEEGGQVNFVEF